MPPVKSMNVLPSTSVTVEPDARSMKIGCIVLTPGSTAARRRASSAELFGPGTAVSEIDHV